MSGEALAPIPEDPRAPSPRRGLPILGALSALAVSAGLVWWLALPQTPSPAPAPAAALRPTAAAQPAPRAPATADRAQVRRAFEAVQDAYANGGAEGLARADADCAAALKADPRVLDYCLAFDLFATAVAPQSARANPGEARLAEARAALPPGADADGRVSEVRSLIRQTILGEGTPSSRTAAEAPPPLRPRLAPAVRLAVAGPAHGMPRHAGTGATKQRREAARAAVQALFARADSARNAASDADVIGQIYAERSRTSEQQTAPY